VWLRISSLRLDAEGVAVGWTDVYVDPAFSDIADVVRAEPETLISTIIESRYGRRIAAIRQETRGKLIPDALAGVLSTKSGSAGLEIVRFYDDTAGDTIEVSVSVHPGGSVCRRDEAHPRAGDLAVSGSGGWLVLRRMRRSFTGVSDPNRRRRASRARARGNATGSWMRSHAGQSRCAPAHRALRRVHTRRSRRSGVQRGLLRKG
jgi:hypothetical protein